MADLAPDVLSGVRALLAVPTYGPADPACQKSVRVAMMVAANHGLRWAGDASPDRQGFAAGRNTVAQLAHSGGRELSDGVMWIDSDMMVPPGAIAELLHSAVVYKADFVSGVYHQRAGIHRPVFYEYMPKKEKFRVIRDYAENVFIPMGACGFGFVWTGLGVLERIANSKNFNQKRGWFPDDRDASGFGEDLNFCHQALKSGSQLYINTAVQLGHMGEPKTIYRADYLAQLKAGADLVVDEPDEVWGNNANWSK